MHHARFTTVLALALGALACADDTVRPSEDFALTGCPSGRLTVDAPIALEFTAPAAPNTVVHGNVVVSNALTGLEIPGTLALSNGGRTIVYTPSANLPFDTPVRIRVQNLLSANTSTPFELTVCEALTAPPPITELWWDELTGVSAGRLLGGSMYDHDSGFVATNTVPVFRRTENGWRVVFNEPYLQSSFDVAFPTLARGFASHLETRVFRGVITESLDAGGTFDTVYTQPSEPIYRLYFRQRSAGDEDYFGVAGSGTFNVARFIKWRPETHTFGSVASFGATLQVADIDFSPSDTARGAGVSSGILFPGGFVPGRVFVSANGGNAWSEVAGVVADAQTVAYNGVATRGNGEIYVTGGGGYVARLTPSGAGGYTAARLLRNAVVNPDPTNFQALQYNDVQFDPDDDQVGWIVGAQLISLTGLAPRFQGLIFETRDGGQTWIRQGVRGADAFGADLPRVNRIVTFTGGGRTSVWLLGDAGLVLRYNP